MEEVVVELSVLRNGSGGYVVFHWEAVLASELPPEGKARERSWRGRLEARKYERTFPTDALEALFVGPLGRDPLTGLVDARELEVRVGPVGEQVMEAFREWDASAPVWVEEATAVVRDLRDLLATQGWVEDS